MRGGYVGKRDGDDTEEGRSGFAEGDLNFKLEMAVAV